MEPASVQCLKSEATLQFTAAFLGKMTSIREIKIITRKIINERCRTGMAG